MRRAAAALLALPLLACAGTGPAPQVAAMPETRPLSAALPPAGRPGASELTGRMRLVSLVDGASMTLDVVRDGDGLRGQESDGCVWTGALDWFSPADGWEGCGDSRNWRAAQGTTREIEPLYPLREGASGLYERDAVSHTGRRQTRTTRCEVVDAVEVLRPGGAATPAWVVACSDGKRRRVTWYAPGEGPVAYRQVHPEKGVEEAWVRAE